VTGDEWALRAADLALPPDVQEIASECRTLQDRSFERFVIWLTIPSESLSPGGQYPGG
jgi:hypothetical protein